MTPIEILSDEHRVIEQMLVTLEAIVREARTAGRLDGQAASDAVSFFRGFADRCHHGKEETHLFPALESKGFPREGGPTGAMIREHEQSRAFVRAMDENIAAAAAAEPAAIERFIAAADAYVAMLREHIYKEDHILFPLADRTLSPDDQQKLLTQFERVEVQDLGAGTHDRFLELARRLAERYEVREMAVPTHTSGFRCCSH